MATSAATLTARTRRFLRDFPEQDSLTASVSSGGTTLTVADGTLYAKNWRIQLDDECLVVTSNGTGTSVPVRRGQYGSTGASHANASTVEIRPAFLNVEILDSLNAAIDAAFPLIYQPIVDESLTVSATAYEYTIPNDALTLPIRYLSEVQYQYTTDLGFRKVSNWTVNRGTTPKIRFSTPFTAGGTLRLIGFGPFPHLTSSTSLATAFPYDVEDLLVAYAAQRLLASGEAGKVRFDTGARDDRESAVRTGSSLSASNALLQRFQIGLRNSAMPPMPRNLVQVF